MINPFSPLPNGLQQIPQNSEKVEKRVWSQTLHVEIFLYLSRSNLFILFNRFHRAVAETIGNLGFALREW